jgi:hypothetical protein
MCRNYRLSLVSLIGVLFVTGCRPSSRVTTPAPDTEVPSPTLPAIIPSGRNAWTISPTTVQHDYIALTSARIDIDSSTVASYDTLSSRIEFSLAEAGLTGSRDFSGIVKSLQFTGGRSTGSSSLPGDLPYAFSAHWTNDTLVLGRSSIQRPDAINDCTHSAVLSVIPTLERALVSPPTTVQRGTSWTDTVSVPSCAGSVPIRLTVIRTYLVAGEGNLHGMSTILAERKDKTVFSGEGAQEQHLVKVTGGGTGSAELHLDALTGILLQSDGEQASVIVITTSGRTRKFRQSIREVVSLAR